MSVLLEGRTIDHSWITDECRKNRGDDGAIEEVMKRVREKLIAIVPRWGADQGTEFHIGVTVKPKDGD